MAKKRTEKKTKTFSEAIGLQYIFNNTITDFFIGLALVVIAVVIIIAMISFLNTGANDQSLLENLKPGENKIKVKIGNLIANEIWIKDDMGKLREWNWAWKEDPDLSKYSAGLFGPIKLIHTEGNTK